MKFPIDFFKRMLAILREHKKKTIFLLVTPLLIYIVKKKASLGHVIYLLSKMQKIVSLLPLPEIPVARKTA